MLLTPSRSDGHSALPHAGKSGDAVMFFAVEDQTVILQQKVGLIHVIRCIMIPTTSSDITMKLNSCASAAMNSSSFFVKTLPTGLWGVFTINILVRGVIARLELKNENVSIINCREEECSVPKFIKIDSPIVAGGLIERLGWRVQRNVYRFTSVEYYRWKILIEERFKHDNFISLF